MPQTNALHTGPGRAGTETAVVRENNQEAQADELLRMTDAAKLSTLAPRIQAALNEIAGPGDNVLEALSSNVAALQEGFIDRLYAVLSENGIDLSQKLTLRLNAGGSLAVAGNRPDKEAVENALRGQPALSAAFGEIASQSELLRDISNINKVMTRRTGAERYAETWATPGAAVYQMSLKGDMSHFYFSRSD
jgi:hypothetical protein